MRYLFEDKNKEGSLQKTCWYGYGLLWPRRTLARPTLATVRPTLARARPTFATTFNLATLPILVGPGRFWPTDRPPPDRPKISRFFFLLPPPFSFFFSISGDLLVEFWWCFGRSGPQTCLFTMRTMRTNLSLKSPNSQSFSPLKGSPQLPAFQFSSALHDTYLATRPHNTGASTQPWQRHFEHLNDVSMFSKHAENRTSCISASRAAATKCP